MKNIGRAKKGQFSIIAALLVSVILVTSVISTYSLVRNATTRDSPKVLSAIGEINIGIKRILDFPDHKVADEFDSDRFYFGAVLLKKEKPPVIEVTKGEVSNGKIKINIDEKNINVDFGQVLNLCFLIKDTSSNKIFDSKFHINYLFPGQENSFQTELNVPQNNEDFV